jgi:mRNA interferase MazF
VAAYAFGTIILVPFPFTDQSAARQRPAVVVSSAAYLRARQDLILMPITSQLRVDAFGDLLVQDWQAARLLMPSAIKPVLTTLAQNLAIKPLGALSPRDQDALKLLIPQLLG